MKHLPTVALRRAVSSRIRPRTRDQRPLAVILATSLLASCATTPPSAISTTEAARAYRARSLDDVGLRTFASRLDPKRTTWPPARLDAHALDVAALYFSPAVQAAEAKWRVARAAIRTAGERPNPTLSVDPLYVTNAAAGLLPLTVSASLVQILETAGKRPYRVARAQYQAEAARLEVLNAGWDVMSRVEGLLLDASAAQSRLVALDRQVAAQRGLVEAAQKRLTVGVGTSLELATARSVLTRAVLDRQASAAALVEDSNQLAIAVGVPADHLPIDRLELPSLTRPLPAGFADKVHRFAPLDRADLLARLADYAASDAAVRLQLAGRYPNLDVGPSFEFDQGDRKWGLTLASSLPIFNRNEGAIGEAVAARRQAADQFTASQAGVIGEVDRSVAAYDQGALALEVAERLYAEQGRRAQAQETLFARGEIDRVELLAARAELAAATTGRVDAQGALARAALAVETAGQLAADGFDPTSRLLAEVKP